MEFNFFIKGLILGFSIAAPVGPIGILCIKRTLAYGRLSGFISGLGATTADCFYGVVAAFGLTTISNIFLNQQFWFRLIGGLFLLYLGIKTFLSKPSEKQISDEKKHNLIHHYISVVFLTITNPTTILSFAAMFAGLGLGNMNNNFLTALSMVVGVATGSMAWWLILSEGVSLLRKKINTTRLTRINQFSGVIIISFAAFALMGILIK